MKNEFLKQAKELNTPARKKGDVKEELLTSPAPPQAKRACTTFEKWLKNQKGDTTLLRDPRLQNSFFFFFCYVFASWVS